MDTMLTILYFLCAFIIFWAMIGYPLFIQAIGSFYKHKNFIKDYSHQPSVTIMVVAHNEEKVILDKLYNIVELEYPKDKIEFLISSDNSTDRTNNIVKKFIKDHPQYPMQLYEVKARKGKTNAQNEAYKIVNTDYIVLTDANAIMKSNAIVELMAAFTSPDIAYVSGKLFIINQNVNNISSSEANYWNKELLVREIEGRIQTITAGNGAIYSCRTSDYYHFSSIESHDTAMPLYYALKGKRAICNHDAIAYEKAGELIEDEFKRKVRMNRVILKHILPDIRILNIFKYKWFSFFYLGHRSCRYLLWLSHLLLFITNLILLNVSIIFVFSLAGQIVFYTMGILGWKGFKNRLFILIHYYCVTIGAQWLGVFNIVRGKNKPFWEKAESTR